MAKALVGYLGGPTPAQLHQTALLKRRVADLEAEAAAVRHPKVPIGNWTFSNWPLYMDKPLLKEFDKKYGGKVKYLEDINDNTEFFGKVRQQLAQGAPIGRDIAERASLGE